MGNFGFVEFCVLGGVEAVRDGQVVSIDSAKQRALLAMLLIHANEVVATDRLLEALWGENPPDGGVRTLRFHVSKLRDALDPDRTGTPLITKSPGYMIEADVTSIDAAKFESMVADAGRLSKSDPEQAAELYVKALSLWRGRAYAEFQYEDFAVAEAKRLDEVRLSAVEDRIELELSLGRHFELTAELEALVVEHPLRERFTELWMLALYRSGRQAEALRAYQVLRQQLISELGADPSPRVAELEQRILEQDPTLDVRVEARPTGVRRAVRGYELREKIFKSALGDVYRGYQPSMGREVAIEVIGSGLADIPEFIQRFEADMDAVAALEHPHVLPIYDYWRESGGAYVVYRWLRGGDLAAAIQRDEWDHGRALSLLRKVGAAVAYAHQMGIAHLDISPARILLDDDGTPYLAGFGSSRLVDAAITRSSVPAPNTPAYAAPEQLVGAATGVWTDLYQLALVAYELLTGVHPFAAPTPEETVSKRLEGSVAEPPNASLPEAAFVTLRRATSLEVEQRPDSVMAFVDDLVASLGIETQALEVERRNPYKGLEAFHGSDASDFYGRTSLIDGVIGRFAEDSDGHRFLALVGPSGSGKSSVARAGVVPALRRGAIRGSDHWLFAEMIPGKDPIAALEDALREVATGNHIDLAAALKRDELGIHETVRRMLPGEGWELFLLVDQFEELFTMAEEPDRSLFIDGLVAAVQHPRSQLRLLITLRADHFDRPLHIQSLGSLMRSRTETVLPLSPAEMEEAITAPATNVGMDIEPGLVGEVLADVADQPGALPLMQYALTELFDASDTQMTVSGYKALGGVAGALSQRSDRLLERLSPRARAVADQVFLELVELGEGAEDARRRVPRSRLERIDPAAVTEILDVFGKARLLSFDSDATTRSATVEVAHEALIREWPHLRNWVDESRERVRTSRRLESLAAEWEASGREPALLLSGSRLESAEEIAHPALAGFLEASRAASSRRRRRSRLAVAGLIALSVLLAAASLVAVRNSQAAQRESVEALAGRAEALADSDPALAVAVALEARARLSSPVTEGALLQALGAFGGVINLPVATLEGFAGTVWDVTFTPDGSKLVAAIDNLNGFTSWDTTTFEPDGGFRRVDIHGDSLREVTFAGVGGIYATASIDGTAAVWDVDSENYTSLFEQHTERVWTVDLSSDASKAASGGVDGQIAVWDAATGTPIAEHYATTSAGTPNEVWSVQFGPSDRLVAAIAQDGTLYLWDWTAAEITKVQAHDGPGQEVRFVDGGSAIVTVGEDGMARIWDAESLVPLGPPLGHPHPLRAGSVSPNGDLLVTVGVAGQAWLWDLRSRRALAPLAGHLGSVWDAAFSPDGKLVATAGQDGSVLVWQLASTPGFQEFAGHAGGLGASELDDGTGVQSVSLSNDGRIATSSRDGTVRVWDVTSGAELLGFEEHMAEVRHAIFSPDSSLIASGDFDGGVFIWDSATRNVVGRFQAGERVTGIAWADDGLSVYVGTRDGVVRQLLVTGEVAGEIPTQGPAVRQLDVDAQGRIATASADGSIRLYSSIRETPDRVIAGHEDSARNVRFDQSGERLFSVGGDGVLFGRDSDSGDEIVRIEAHGEGIRAVAISPDGKRVATGGEDLVIRVWDVASQRLLAEFSGHHADIWYLEFSDDGRFLASASDDGTATLRYVGSEADVLCGWIERYTTKTELMAAIGDEPVVCTDLPMD